MVFVYFLKIILTFKKIKYLYIQDLQKSNTKIFAIKDVLMKQRSVLDSKLNSTSIDGLYLFLENYLNLQKKTNICISKISRKLV
jgi:hypothetical protein